MDSVSGAGNKARKVDLWSRVAVQNAETNEQMSITIVPVDVADPAAGKVSIGAPLAVALMGHQAGESVQVGVHDGNRVFRILNVIPIADDPSGRGHRK